MKFLLMDARSISEVWHAKIHNSSLQWQKLTITHHRNYKDRVDEINERAKRIRRKLKMVISHWNSETRTNFSSSHPTKKQFRRTKKRRRSHGKDVIRDLNTKNQIVDHIVAVFSHPFDMDHQREDEANKSWMIQTRSRINKNNPSTRMARWDLRIDETQRRLKTRRGGCLPFAVGGQRRTYLLTSADPSL